jgi:predicted transcriptional regulator
MNYSYLLDLTQRVESIEKKLDALFSAVSKIIKVEVKQPVKKIQVDEDEQNLFLFLYESHRAVDYAQMCERLRKSEPFVRYCLNSLIEKGVPVKKHTINRKAYFMLDSDFKELQAKQSVVGIKKTLTLDVFDQKILV